MRTVTPFAEKTNKEYVEEFLKRNCKENALCTRYADTVLEGLWFDNRIGRLQKENAIVPCLLEKQKCLTAKSEYQERYPTHLASKELIHAYKEEKLNSFDNMAKQRSSVIPNTTTEQYLHNFATTSHLSYEVLPRKARAAVVPMPPVKTVPEDTICSYGNITTTGLRCYLQKKRANEKCAPWDLTTYRQAYGNHGTWVKSMGKIPSNGPYRRIC